MAVQDKVDKGFGSMRGSFSKREGEGRGGIVDAVPRREGRWIYEL